MGYIRPLMASACLRVQFVRMGTLAILKEGGLYLMLRNQRIPLSRRPLPVWTGSRKA